MIIDRGSSIGVGQDRFGKATYKFCFWHKFDTLIQHPREASLKHQSELKEKLRLQMEKWESLAVNDI